jgi:LEA14-like dessication related protein
MDFKKFLPYVIGGGLLFAVLKFTRKSIAAKILNVKISNVKLLPIKNASIVLSVINPTNTPISFNSITADILLNGNAFSTINTNKATTISPNSSVNINLPIKINPLEGAKLALDLLKKPAGYVINIQGTINSESINFPINIEYILK